MIAISLFLAGCDPKPPIFLYSSVELPKNIHEIEYRLDKIYPSAKDTIHEVLARNKINQGDIIRLYNLINAITKQNFILREYLKECNVTIKTCSEYVDYYNYTLRNAVKT